MRENFKKATNKRQKTKNATKEETINDKNCQKKRSKRSSQKK